MDLKAWIDLERGRQTKLAAEIGAQPQLVWQWAHGKRPIPADRRPDIERATGGAVTCEEMTSDEVVWSRISDAHWKWHPLGRPVRDLTREARLMDALMLKRRCAFCGKRGGDPVGCAVEILGGQSKLAAAIGVRQQHVWNWLNRDTVPPEFCAAIERATEGKVTRRDLRPSDWWRIWPELVTEEHPIPVEAA